MATAEPSQYAISSPNGQSLIVKPITRMSDVDALPAAEIVARLAELGINLVPGMPPAVLVDVRPQDRPRCRLCFPPPRLLVLAQPSETPFTRSLLFRCALFVRPVASCFMPYCMVDKRIAVARRWFKVVSPTSFWIRFGWIWGLPLAASLEPVPGLGWCQPGWLLLVLQSWTTTSTLPQP